MQITVFGRTDKRACIYTLMKILQPLGDVAVITNNRHFTRLTEDGGDFGFYQNISIFVTDVTADEMWTTIEHAPDDFDHVILDGLYNEFTDMIIYIQGAGVEAQDEFLFDTFGDAIKVIKMGRGKGGVPYSSGLMSGLESIEYYRKFIAPSEAMLNILAKELSAHLNMPVKNIIKVASRK